MNYVTFEGVEGVGKSYYLEKLKIDDRFFVILDDDLNNEALNIVESLRSDDIFFRSNDPMVEFVGFSRVDLATIKDKVIPNLNHKIVLQDRGADTTCLYAALGLANENKTVLDFFNELFEKRKKMGMISDKVILLIDDVDSCISRAEKRNGKPYTIDQKDFVKRVNDGFLMLSKEFPERFFVIDVRNNNVLEKIKELFA